MKPLPGTSVWRTGGPTIRRYATEIDPHHPNHLVQHGYTVLVTRPDGGFCGGRREGLWDYDTRILSHYRITVDGRRPRYVSGGVLESDRWLAFLCNDREGGDAVGPALPQDRVEICLGRRLGSGMEERLTVRNHSMVPLSSELVIELDADFLDVQEEHRDEGYDWRVDRDPDPAGRRLVFRYTAEADGRQLERALRVRIGPADSEPEIEDQRIRFPLELPSRGKWQAQLHYDSFVDGVWREPHQESASGETEHDRLREAWRSDRARVESSDGLFDRIMDQAAEDLFSLRLWEYDQGPDAWLPKAGAPSYSGVFGRDSLTAGWQSAVIGPEPMRGALAILAKTQAREDSAWRDAEPGKMLHELRRGPLSELEIIPQSAYYGTQTSASMFVLVLAELWHWTGDDGVLHRYRDAALLAIDWAERYGDADGDGFLEYEKRSSRGLRNHGWKDSDEAIRHPDGEIAETPIATVEEQAYHFVALQRMAEIMVALGEGTRAEELLERAANLRARWHGAYWMEEEGFYAMALDRKKQPVRTVGSNPGHALGAGLVPTEQARAVSDRLMAPDLFSGWGVRSLSSKHPSYNPLGYHLGTVWPVENATFALGFKRYGLEEHAERLITAQLLAARHFSGYRLPELLGGHGRDEAPVPVVYPDSNSPQAWSASATLQFLQVMLGIYPFAPARLLVLVRPRLPAWLPAVTVRRIRVGDATVSLRFERGDGGWASHEVVERAGGRLFVLRAPPPQDLTPERQSTAEHVKEWLLEHAPGRLARAARIALALE